MRTIRGVVVYLWAAVFLIIGLPYRFYCRRLSLKDYAHGMAKQQRFVYWFANRIVRLAGVQLEVEGVERIPQEGPVVFVGNHQSFFDIPVLLAAIPRSTGFVAKSELKKVPLLSSWMVAIESVFLEREEDRKAVETLLTVSKRLKAQPHGLVIFPEGTRSQNGDVAAFKPGSFKFATRSEASLVTFAIDGTRDIMPCDSYFFTPGQVKLSFLSVIPGDGIRKADTLQLAEASRTAVRAALHQDDIHEE